MPVTTTHTRIAMVTWDCIDPGSLARWWAEQMGGTIVQENEGWFVIVALADGPALAFQKVEQPTTGKNRIHLDLTVVGDLDANADAFIEAGATLVDKRSMADFRWVTLADPDGNQFCIAGPH